MGESNYIKLYTGNFIAVQRIVQSLEDHNIIPVLKDEGESARLAGFGATINDIQDVFVSKDEYETALDVLEKVKINI